MITTRKTPVKAIKPKGESKMTQTIKKDKEAKKADVVDIKKKRDEKALGKAVAAVGKALKKEETAKKDVKQKEPKTKAAPKPKPDKTAKEAKQKAETKPKAAAPVKVEKPKTEKKEPTKEMVPAKVEKKEEKEKNIVLISLNRQEIENVLSVAKEFTSQNDSAIPVLSHIHFKAKDGKALIAATDLERMWTRTIACECPKSVDVCIPLGILRSEINALRKEITKIELMFEEIDKDNQRVRVNNRVFFYTMKGNEFPVIDRPKPESMKQIVIKDFGMKLGRVIKAAGETDTRYILNTVCVNAEGVIGTNGHRLHMVKDKIETEKPFLLPRKTAELITKLKAADEFVLGENLAAFSVQAGTMISKLTEGTYPDISKVIPTEFIQSVKVDTSELMAVIDGVLPLAKEGSAFKVILESSKKLLILASNPAVGEYRWQLDCEAEGELDGAASKGVGFNGEYLKDALKAFAGDKTLLRFSGVLSPCLVNGEDKGFALVMPMRV
jgi:DNA polymerase-3 subunit beta